MNANSPIWITNFKTYEQSVNENAIQLGLIHEKVAKETGKNVWCAVNAIDLQATADIILSPVLAQHVDGIEYGSHTGHIHPATVQNAGAIGTLLNHSENRVSFEALQAAITACKKYELKTIVCAESPAEVAKFAELKPDMLAFEPPQLIGSSDISVADEPELITQSIEKANGIPLLVGAGINKPADIRTALDLGAQGFLVASAIVKSDNPEATLRLFLTEF
ncbi:triose-phosphate isomerase [bacterium DOLZORAL124_38_8]|nr:MAG: triose-phosphate isomerase [bacterium DOLZORAL124_38_8]